MKNIDDFLPFGAYVITSNDHVEIARDAAEGGTRVIQYREKDAEMEKLLRRAKEIRKITDRYGVLFLVNDYPDIAKIVNADGVHLGQDDVPLEDAREILGERSIIGISTHSLAQAEEAEREGADYIAIGSVYKTPIKAEREPVGLETVREVIEKVSIPVVVIGGINLSNIKPLLDIGVRNFAMIRAFRENTTETVREVNRLIEGQNSEF